MECEKEFTFDRLLAVIGRLQATRADQAMDKIGLFRGQAFLLMILSHHDGLTHSEIAQKMNISPAAVTKIIQRMEKLNYVQRFPDPSDERISRVFLQEEGKAVIQQIRRSFDEIDGIIIAGLSEDECETLKSLLLRVLDNLKTRNCGKCQ
jgi:DNA-binding MarR family transcriptional regulator